MNPGDNQAGIQFADYVDAVVEVLQRQHRKVILVGHSSAGMLLQAAVPHVAEAIRLVVFSNAFVMANGQSQLDNVPADAAAGLTALAQSTPDNTVPVEPLVEVLILVTDTEALPVSKSIPSTAWAWGPKTIRLPNKVNTVKA